MTYEIEDFDQLESSAADLANSNQKILGDASSLTYIIKQIRANWQNETGKDINSALTELEACTDKIQNAINPVVGKYVETMNTLVAESRRIEGQTV